MLCSSLGNQEKKGWIVPRYFLRNLFRKKIHFPKHETHMTLFPWEYKEGMKPLMFCGGGEGSGYAVSKNTMGT